MDDSVYLAAERLPNTVGDVDVSTVVAPGETVISDPGFMSGHGTYKLGEELVASVVGVPKRINKLLTVLPLKSRYNGEVGDVVVGRVVEVQQRQWRVDTCSRLHSVLMLSSVNLPGGEQRRKTVHDELSMRAYLEEGDLVSAEVQNVMSDGTLSLHTRSLKYGKLSQGCMVRVPPALVVRRKNHFHDLPCGATIILGNNGYIWVCPTSEQSEGGGGYLQNLEKVPLIDREVVTRVRNCVLALAQCRVRLFDTSVLYAFEASSSHSVNDLLRPEVIQEVGSLTRQRLAVEANS